MNGDRIVTEYHKDSSPHDHENTKVLMALLVISTACIVLVQIGMNLWRKRYQDIFQVATLCALFCVPPVIAIPLRYWWFIFWWSIFFIFSGLTYYKAREKPLQPSTPRVIFNRFYIVHISSFVLAIIGFVLYIMGFFICLIQHSHWVFNLGSLLWFYGVYFGLLARDLAMHITDTIFVHPCFSSPDLPFPDRAADSTRCSLCGHYLHVETQCTISCEHTFHESCIRGWCMLGKKSTCPQCREKVDYQLDESNPWETPDSVLHIYHELLHWAVIYFPILLGVLGILNLILLRHT